MHPTTLKRPPGRPRKDGSNPEKKPSEFTPPIKLDRDVDKAADEMAKKRILPQPPGKKLSFEEVQEYFKLMTPQMWTHVTLYVYRDHPKILRQLKDPSGPRYIDCLSQPIDMDYMIEHHGGGRYSMTACDTDAKFGSSGNRLFECDFEINESKYEPKLNYEELDVNAKQNMAYVSKLQYRGILDSKGHPMAPQPAPAAGNSEAMLKTFLEYTSKMTEDQRDLFKEKLAGSDQQALSKSIGDLLLEKMRQDDPNKQSAMMLGLMKEVLAATQKPTSSSEGITVKDILQITNEQNKTFLLLFEKFSEHKTEPAPNPQIEQFKEMLGLAKDLAASFHGGGGGQRNGWDIGLDYVKEIVPPVLNFMSMNRTGRPMPGGMPMPGATAPAAFDPYANPEAARALARNMAAQQAATAPAANNAAVPPSPANELAALVQTYAAVIVQHLNMGTPGHMLGDYLTGLLGNGTHAQICAQGEPALVQALQSVPEIAIFGEPRLKKFVHEFVNFQEFLDAEEEEGDSESDESDRQFAADGEAR